MSLSKMNQVAKDMGITLTQEEGKFVTKPCKRERAWKIADRFFSSGFAVSTFTVNNRSQVYVEPDSYSENHVFHSCWPATL